MLNPIYKCLTWLILLLGLAGSGAASYWLKSDIDTRAYQEFVSHCGEIQLKITARLKAHEQTLLGGAAMFDASQKVTRQEWSAYVKRLRISDHFNGIQGLGFSLWIPATQLSAHQAQIRAEGFSDYKVRPEGEREAYTSVIFLEPFTERNLRAFGYDMYSESVRHAAMVRARDENTVILSGRVTLQQETDKDIQAGTLMYAPVYKQDKPIATVEQRRAAVLGWVYSPFRMADLLNNIGLFTQASDSTQVRLRVYDGYDTQVEHLLYDNNASYADTESINHKSLVQLINDFNGTVWTLQFEQLMEFNGVAYSKAWITLGTGVLISILLFLLSRSYLTTRINAANIAAKLTSQLKESESRFRLLADSAPVLIWLSGIDKLFYQFNQVWLDFTGRTLAQEQGHGWAEGVHADDLQHCLDIYITSFDAHLPFKMEYRLRRYDGEYRWLLDTGMPRFADDGIFLGYIGSCIDITERKQAEYLLHRESEKNIALLRNASDGIHILDTDGNIIEVSDSFCAMLGYSRNEMIGMNVTQWDVNFSTDECIRVIKQQFEKPVRSLFETRHRCKDGRIIDVEVSGFPLVLDGKPVLFNSSRDITERKRVENDLYNSQALLQTAQRAARLGYYVADLHIPTEITWTNDPLFDDIYGLDSHFVRNMENWSQIIHPEDRQRVMDDFQQFILRCKQFPSPESIDSIAYRIIRPNDGTEHWVEAWAYNFYDDNGNPTQQVGMVRDITERKRMEEKLRESENKLNTILDNVEAYIYIKDDQYRYQYANKLMREMFAQPLEAIIGKTDKDFFDSHTAANLYNNDRRIIEFGERVAIEEINTRKDSTFHNTYFSVKQPLCHDNGNIYGLCGISTDITERKQMEDALKASKVFIASILDSLSTQIAVLDDQGTIILVNKAWQQFAEQNALPETNHNFVFYNYLQVCENAIGHDNAEEAADVLHGIKAVLAGTAQYYYTEYPCHSASEKRWFYMTVSPLQGSKRGVVISHENITERKCMEHALKESEIKFKTVADFAYDWEYWVGKDRQIIYISPSCEKISGYKAEEFLADNELLKKIIHPEDERLWDDHVGQAHFFEQIHDDTELDFRIIKKDGSVVYINHLCRPVFNDKGNSFGRRVSNRDITERKQAEAALRIAATVFESQEGMFITDANKVILNVNKAFTLITGYSAAEVIGKTPRLLYSGRHDKAFYDAIWQSIQNTGAWQGEIWNQRKNGEVYPEQMSITAVKSSNNTVTHYVATLSDITERKALEEYIHRLAFYDALTQLPNRRLLHERLKHGIELNHRTGSLMAVLMMDLDKFKAVNDSLGHAAGDELLQQVAERVKARLREVDMVARLGGDEFVILLENVDQYEQVAHVAQSIIDTLSQPFTLCQSHEVFIGATIGIGICPHHGSNVETLMDNADAALYHAKDQGRGCFAYFSETLTKKAHERLALEHRLRGAVERQELGIYFQPQIEISSGQLVGAEALVYWDDPVKGCRVMLKDFIDLAKETEVYIAINKWALRETCKLGRQWLNEGLPAVTLAVKISSYQFCHCDMKELVTKVIDETGFPANYLGLEMTETGLMGNQAHALSILNSLNEQSVHLTIDDFGTGYSSLARLKYFPIDILKIDKIFIKNIPFSQDDSVITSTIIDMAHSLGFKVLAEGVETPEQLAFLRQQGCDRYQGYLYSNALSASDFAKLLFDLPKRVN